MLHQFSNSVEMYIKLHEFTTLSQANAKTKQIQMKMLGIK